MAKLDFYGMFDFSTGDTDTYQYTSQEFSDLIKAITTNGISNEGNAFEIVANGLTLTVKSGTCFINGRYGYNKDEKQITLEAETNTLQRIDRLVIELNTINRIIELKVIKGEPASLAIPPSLTQNDLLYQLPLYSVLITGGSNTRLTDERRIVYSPTEAIEKLNKILNGTEYVYAVYA